MSIGVGVPKWRLFSSVVEVLFGVVEVGKTRCIDCEHSTVAHDVSFAEERGRKAGISFLKRVDEVLGREVETVAVELTAGTLEDIGKGAFKLLAPVSTGSIHVLDFPDGAWAILAEFGKDVGVFRIEAVFAFAHQVSRDLIAGLPFAEERMHLGHQALSRTAGGASQCIQAVGTAGRQKFNRKLEVFFDEGVHFIGRGAGLLVLGRGQRLRHERHPSKGLDQVEVPVGANEPGFTQIGIAHIGVHVNFRNLLECEVAVCNAAVGHLPLYEEHLSGAVALESLIIIELRIVTVARAAFVGVIGDDVAEEPAEVRLEARGSLDVRHFLLQGIVAGNGGGQGVFWRLVEVGFR